MTTSTARGREIYSGVKFRSGSLPASTGVGAKNPAGAALAVAAWAMQPLEKFRRPRQGNRLAAAMSRARLWQLLQPRDGNFLRVGRRLFISGTASIAPGGETLWLGDVRRQVAQTMQVVEAILHSRGFGLPDLTRATAYFKRGAEARAFTEWQAARDLQLQSVALVQCDLCRDDLRFELEADAWSSTARFDPFPPSAAKYFLF